MAMSSTRRAARALVLMALALFSLQARASFHLWRIDEIYSDASGSVQFIELSVTSSGEQFLAGHTISVTEGNNPAHTLTFPSDLPGDTANRHFLIATAGFAKLGLVTPDYVVPDGFLYIPEGTIDYAGVDVVGYHALPTDGVHSIDRNGNAMVNSPTNFAGKTATIGPAPAASASALENPQPGSFQSGVGLVSGWSCQGPAVGIAVDGQPQVGMPYGSSRTDTAGVCGTGNTNTGFGLLVNFNLMGSGPHTAQLIVNGQPQGAPVQFTVTAPAGEFLTGVTRQVTVSDFPTPGRTTVLVWQQSQQNFAIQSVSP
ncbi:MAG: hypothetical protein ACM3QY_04055 [Candidatus Levyibacteriota bacterium]